MQHALRPPLERARARLREELGQALDHRSGSCRRSYGGDRLAGHTVISSLQTEVTMKRWDPPAKCSEREERLLKLAGKSRKLLVFLRERRSEIFDAGFQAELESMYRSTE